MVLKICFPAYTFVSYVWGGVSRLDHIGTSAFITICFHKRLWLQVQGPPPLEKYNFWGRSGGRSGVVRGVVRFALHSCWLTAYPTTHFTGIRIIRRPIRIWEKSHPFLGMRWMFWCCVHNRIPQHSDLILSKYVFESVSASHWFLVCLGVTSVTSFPPRRPMQILVPRSEWGGFNGWVYVGNLEF